MPLIEFLTMIGKTLGHYRVEEKLGAGGMGVVYRAHDEQLDRDVALKVLPADTLADESARKRFRREALALAKLTHPNIAVVHEFATQEGTDFLVMEHISGETLSKKLTQDALSEDEVVRLGIQIASALEEAHEQGVVHWDLKPGNVMVTPKEQAKVLDFGLAKLLRPVDETAGGETLTESHAVMGTLPYMAPEQVEGKTVDARTDIYALGAILYEMATRQRPFPMVERLPLTVAILHRAPQAPREVNRNVSPELEHIILKCLAKDPKGRYPSASELREELQLLGSGIGSSPSVAVVLARSIRKPQVAIPTVLLLAAIVVGAGWWIERSAQVRRVREELLPEITRLIDEEKYAAAFSLASQVKEYVPGDSQLEALWSEISSEASITTTPTGARVFIRENTAGDG
ncbi:MAG: serine/threonine-protein kinase, partial [Acidobacteria bacterium]|nr:serine/threonine-protein kinase [Acidobacteriota bacterium]